MNEVLILILVAIILGFLAIIWFVNHKLGGASSSKDQVLMEWLKTTQAEMNKLQLSVTQTLQQSDKNVTDTLQKSYTEMQERLDKTAKAIGELKEETGKFSEIGRSMHELQDFLNSPKLRGNIGEQVLGDLLGQMLPKEAYQTQYRFKSGDIVDIVIRTQAGLIPIDSKFPMENFIKMNAAESKKDETIFRKLFISDVKKHIKAISTKYIKSSENTVDFALMYIPSESMYYDITANAQELTEYSQSLRVLPVSPATFYAFLRTILISFEGQRIAKEAQTLLQSLRDIQKTTTEFGDHLNTLGRHISNAYNNMNSINTEYSQLKSKVDSTKAIGHALESEKLPEAVWIQTSPFARPNRRT